MGKVRVLVLFGGRSAEHEVSVVSARSIINALDPARYEVRPVYITRAGRWVLEPARAWAALDGGPEAALPGRPEARPEEEAHGLPVSAGSLALASLTGEEVLEVDVAFPVLHGPYGEDGTVQGLLELAGIPYVGAPVLGSALGMDKVLMKAVFMARGLPVVPHTYFLVRDFRADPAGVLARVQAEIGLPCFVKPANLGSSVGVSKVTRPEELTPAVERAAQYDRKVLVERAVNARELECSVLGNDDPVASGVGEVVPAGEFYDYRAKYQDSRTQLLIPAPIPDAVAEEVRRLSVAAFKALDLAGMARVDFFYCRDSGRLYINEVNTIPGFTPVSMYPKLWEAAGLSYGELVDRLIGLAIERHQERSRWRTEPD